jgi:hypothetical protein
MLDKNSANSVVCREDLNPKQFIISSIRIDDTLKNRSISKLREAKKAIDNFEIFLNIENNDNFQQKSGRTKRRDSLSLLNTTRNRFKNTVRPVKENDDNLGLGTKKALNILNFRSAFDIKKDISRFQPSKNKLHLMNYERGEAELMVNILDKIKNKRDDRIRLKFEQKNAEFEKPRKSNYLPCPNFILSAPSKFDYFNKNLNISEKFENFENSEKLKNPDGFNQFKTSKIIPYTTKPPQKRLILNSFKKLSNTKISLNKFKTYQTGYDKTSTSFTLNKNLIRESRKKLTESNIKFDKTNESIQKDTTNEFQFQSPITSDKFIKNYSSPLLTNINTEIQNYKNQNYNPSENFKFLENSLSSSPNKFNFKDQSGNIREITTSQYEDSPTKISMKENYQKAVPRKFSFKSSLTEESNYELKSISRNGEKFSTGLKLRKNLPEVYKKSSEFLKSFYKVLQIEEQKATLILKTNNSICKKKNLTFN